jgi:CheY-like chemotaxis protein/nitrogen-specific signal transduction histidine kinase
VTTKVLRLPARNLYMGLWTDITELKRKEQEVEKARRAADAANRAKSRFLASMSHEIRTPMTNVIGYAELLRDMDPEPEERRHYLKTVLDNAHQLMTLISDILDLTQLDIETVKVDKRQCSPVEIVEDVRRTLQPRAEEKLLFLRVNCVTPIPEYVLTDPVRVRQILVNLVDNAIKFTDEGVVRVDVAVVGLDSDHPKLEFEVSDTGMGIPEEQLGRLFEPFTQVDEAIDRRHRGAGLGLAISQHLAGMLGGRIEVQSQEGEGSVFTLSVDPGPLGDIPLLESLPPAVVKKAEADHPKAIPRLHGRVLLVEDDENFRYLLTRYLVSAGLEVESAVDGERAYEMAVQSLAAGAPYDLILMDIRIPKMDGYEVTFRLRQEGWKGPIIAQTAHALTGEREKCLAAGCDDYVAKPAEPEDLIEVAGQYLRQPERIDDAS